MKTIDKKGSIQKYEEFISFIESLKNLDERKWASPIAENKWSVKNIIGHIMVWDKYMLEEAILKIKTNQHVTIENLNIDDFNKKAVEYVKTKNKEDILNQTIHYRKEIIENLTLLPEKKFFSNYTDNSGNNFAIYNYLEEFIEHDEHHKRQIEQFLNSIN
ncbi:DinB family protein [Neobacillus citreus]|uniref:DinB family protein n=1 Tax=Neobacillus citreus TaxID=2833578 RepID=A0A942YDL4_9BACI|nr:DinB family protein [Neobacillus citreus]